MGCAGVCARSCVCVCMWECGRLPLPLLPLPVVCPADKTTKSTPTFKSSWETTTLWNSNGPAQTDDPPFPLQETRDLGTLPPRLLETKRSKKKNTGQHLERTCRTGSPHCCCCCCSVAPAVIRDFESAVRDGRGKQDVCLKTTRRQAATMRQRGNGSQCTVVVCRSFRHASQPVPFGALQQTPRAPCTHPCQAQNGFIVILNCTLRAPHPHLSPHPFLV